MIKKAYKVFIRLLNNGILRFINMNIGWMDLSGIAKSNILKVTSYWLLLTPILSKFLNAVNEIDLSYIGFNSAFNLSLPFNWQILFFSALMFAIGNTTYTIFCPKIISRYKNYQDYVKKSNSLNDMVEFLADETVRDKNFMPNMLLVETVARHTPSSEIHEELEYTDINNVKDTNWKKAVNSLKESNKEKLAELFSSVRLFSAEKREAQRKICYFSYLLGFALLFVVLLQNIKSVLISIF